jgi:RecA/RadA recombinase
VRVSAVYSKSSISSITNLNPAIGRKASYFYASRRKKAAVTYDCKDKMAGEGRQVGYMTHKCSASAQGNLSKRKSEIQPKIIRKVVNTVSEIFCL